MLTGVLEATVRDPSKVGPRRQAYLRAYTPKKTSASAGDPTPFSGLRGVPGTELGAHLT
jgi:hypothetical protein